MPVNIRDQPNTAAAIRFVEKTWNVLCFGFATSGHVANSDHYRGLALDCMTGDSRGDQIAQWFISNPSTFGTKYVIWQRRIWTPAAGWHPYTGSNPHTNHVHVSLVAGGGSGQVAAGSVLPVGLSIPNPLGGVTDVLGQLNKMVEIVGQTHFWFRVFEVILGVSLIIVGIMDWLKPAIEPIIKAVT